MMAICAVVGEMVPGWSKAVKSAAMEAAGSSTGGSGWAPSGLASLLGVHAAQGR